MFLAEENFENIKSKINKGVYQDFDARQKNQWWMRSCHEPDKTSDDAYLNL